MPPNRSPSFSSTQYCTDLANRQKRTASSRYACDAQGRVFAFGEWKHPKEWVRDSRCRCSLTTLQRRMEAGQTAEQAMTSRVFRGSPPNVTLTAWGEEKLLLDWRVDPRCKVGYETVLKRLDNPTRWPTHEMILSTPPQQKTCTMFATYEGVTRSAKEWGEDPSCALTAPAIRKRIATSRPLDRPFAQAASYQSKEKRIVEALDAFEEMRSPYIELPTQYPTPKRLVLTKATHLRLQPHLDELGLPASEVCAMLVVWWEGEPL